MARNILNREQAHLCYEFFQENKRKNFWEIENEFYQFASDLLSASSESTQKAAENTEEILDSVYENS